MDNQMINLAKINDLEKQLNELKEYKIKYETLLNAIPNMAWSTDTKSIYKEVNDQFINHSGKQVEEVIGTDHDAVWNTEIAGSCKKNDEAILISKKPMVFEEVVYGKTGYRRYHINRSPVINDDGEIIGIIAVGTDMTELSNRDMQLTVLIENIPFRVWLCDKDGTYILANTHLANSFNVSSVSELIGRNLREYYTEDIVSHILEENNVVMTQKQTIKFNKQMYENGELRDLEIYKTPVFNLGNEAVGIVGMIVDVTNEKKAKDEIRALAYTDSLTGLLNRRALYEKLEKKWRGQEVSMMIVDLDNFKDINDTHGHHAGDEVLVKLAHKLKNIFSEDLIFRFGGDEFILVFENSDDEVILSHKAQTILDTILTIKLENQSHDGVNASIGIAKCFCDNVRCEEGACKLMMMADIALYKAKESGKNKFVHFTQQLEDENILNNRIEKALKLAVENNEITLYYQPQYNPERKLIGFEALFRWGHPEYSSIPIIKIINILEKSKLIIKIGNEIIRKAMLFAKQINVNSNYRYMVWINVSSIQIMDDSFLHHVQELIKETGVSTNDIGIEITETVLLENIDENIKKMNHLKELGIILSLDDFGTGYSSFNYLVKLPLTEVKIDRSFIIGMDERPEYTTMIKLMIDLSHSLHLSIVAEGVETEEQLQALKELGVDYVQGYYFAKPLPEAEALKLLE